MLLVRLIIKASEDSWQYGILAGWHFKFVHIIDLTNCIGGGSRLGAGSYVNWEMWVGSWELCVMTIGRC